MGINSTSEPYAAVSADQHDPNQRCAYKVLIVDDHALVRDGLRLLLEGLETPIECFDAADCEEGLRRLSATGQLDLILLDLGLPGINGLDAIRLFRAQPACAPIIVISASEKAQDARDTLEAGARGFISKSSCSEVILGAVRLVLSGGTYIPPGLVLAGANEDVTKPVRLTQRQMEVLALLGQGKQNKAIGLALDMAESTVRVHATAIYKALGVSNRTEAAYEAARLGLIPESRDELAPDSLSK